MSGLLSGVHCKERDRINSYSRFSHIVLKFLLGVTILIPVVIHQTGYSHKEPSFSFILVDFN